MNLTLKTVRCIHFLGSVTQNDCDFTYLREPSFNTGQFSEIN